MITLTRTNWTRPFGYESDGDSRKGRLSNKGARPPPVSWRKTPSTTLASTAGQRKRKTNRMTSTQPYAGQARRPKQWSVIAQTDMNVKMTYCRHLMTWTTTTSRRPHLPLGMLACRGFVMISRMVRGCVWWWAPGDELIWSTTWKRKWWSWPPETPPKGWLKAPSLECCATITRQCLLLIAVGREITSSTATADRSADGFFSLGIDCRLAGSSQQRNFSDADSRLANQGLLRPGQRFVGSQLEAYLKRGERVRAGPFGGLPSGRFFLELFSGNGNLSAAVSKRGMRVGAPVDRRNCDYMDLCDARTLHVILQWIASGIIWCVWIGMPGGPKSGPARDSLIVGLCRVLRAAKRRRVSVVVENPAWSRLWSHRRVNRCLRQCGCERIYLDMCTKRKKLQTTDSAVDKCH